MYVFIIYYFFSMELHLLINGQKCEVKFEKHHTFQRVLNLLRQNKIMPAGVSFDEIDITGKDGRHYTCKNQIIESLIPPETSKCEVKIKYVNNSIDNSLSNSKDSITQVQGVKKARLVDIVKGFFQKMQKHEFKKLQKYQNHHQEIISQIACFAAKYEKLHALNLYYRDKIMKLSRIQEQQLQEYREKYKETFQLEQQENQSKLNQNMQNESLFSQEISRNQIMRESIEQKQKIIQQLKDELAKQKQILDQTIKSYQIEVDVLHSDLIIARSKSLQCVSSIQRKQIQIGSLNSQLLRLQRQMSQKTEQIKNLELQKINMQLKLYSTEQQLRRVTSQSEELKKTIQLNSISNNKQLKQLQKMNAELKQSRRNHKYLQQKYHVQTVQLMEEISRLEYIQAKSHILGKQNECLFQQMSKLVNQLEQIKQQNNDLQASTLKLHKLTSLKLSQKKSTIYLEEISYQPAFKLNECFNSNLAEEFISKHEAYSNKKLTKLTRIIYHPATLYIQTNKILKKLKGRENILLICLTEQDKVVGGFSTLSIDSCCTQEEIRGSKAFLFNIEDSRVNLFELKQGRRPVRYDKNFFILGQEEITIDYQTLTLSSRFVNMTSQENISFNDPQKRRRYLLNPSKKTEVKLKEYWLFDCTFQ